MIPESPALKKDRELTHPIKSRAWTVPELYNDTTQITSSVHRNQILRIPDIRAALCFIPLGASLVSAPATDTEQPIPTVPDQT